MSELQVREENWSREMKDQHVQLGNSRHEDGARMQNIINENNALRRELAEVRNAARMGEQSVGSSIQEIDVLRGQLREKE